MRVLTGIQPSGKLHIGNYFGAMKPMIESMNSGSNEVFCFIADYHALTTLHNAKEMKQNVNDAILDWIACGLDPEKINFYVQSDIPEIHELTWCLHSICPIGLLERSVSYKDKLAKGLSSNTGLFTYPVLMAADILIMNTDIVPVGKDQKQHLEIARDLAEKFNIEYGETFVIPKEQISKSFAVIPGTDGQKMSKSYNNTIPLFAEENVIKKAIMSIVTDSTPVEDSKDPSKCNIFAIYKLVSTKEEQENLAKKYRAGGMGYGDAKKMLFEAIKKYFQKMWDKRKELEKDKNLVDVVRQIGAKKVRVVANKTLEKVRLKVGVK